MPKFMIKTLGCKVNQSESESLARRLEGAGWRRANPTQAADYCIINTCTVTQKASMQSRQAVRQALRANPGAEIIVTGCYAQTAPEEIRQIEGVCWIVGQNDKGMLAEAILKSTTSETENEASAETGPRDHPAAATAEGSRARPFFKVQDGCNAFCTYCIVPHARGRSRSLPLAAALSGIRRLKSEGYQEVVLTGIHLGSYGRDLQPPTDLLQLLRRIRDAGCIERVRLSSIEPLEITPDLIDFITVSQTGPGRVCAHLHVPLQSGDDGILKRMHRPYSPQYFKDLVLEIHRNLPEAAIGVDTLIGFPGESPEAFARTHELIAELPVAYLHVFPFSPRKGTPAYHYADRIRSDVVRERCQTMQEIGLYKKTIFYNNFINSKLEIVVEKGSVPDTIVGGTSANYIQVRLPYETRSLKDRALAWVRAESLTRDLRMRGRLIAPFPNTAIDAPPKRN
jgi:threonylcarbamoyladenosine tRNA methylthiotransferase MtaB